MPREPDLWVWIGVSGDSHAPTQLLETSSQGLWRFWCLTVLARQQISLTQFHGHHKRHNIPGSETKDFVTHSTEHSTLISIFATVPLAPETPVDADGPRREQACTRMGLCCRRGTLNLGHLYLYRNLISFVKNKLWVHLTFFPLKTL